MPFYQKLNASKPKDKRTIENILSLRIALRDKIPQRTLTESLLLATWNIRDFDKSSYGIRLTESLHYMAEIISSFDIVVIQEVYNDLTALKKLLSILGGHWTYIVSDVTEGRRGNKERMAYVYDKRKISFGGLAGQLIIPPKKDDDGNIVPSPQIWRTPLIAGFQAGWARFLLCSVHVLWGKGGAESQERADEIRRIAGFLKDRTEDPHAWARKLILLGDFNIFSRESSLYKILEEHEFESPPQLVSAMTNVNMDKQYDQILLRERVNRFEVKSGGVFPMFNFVFKDDQEDIYREDMKKTNDEGYYKSYRTWRTHQMSDHLPLWVELKIDYSDEYLEDKLED